MPRNNGKLRNNIVPEHDVDEKWCRRHKEMLANVGLKIRIAISARDDQEFNKSTLKTLRVFGLSDNVTQLECIGVLALRARRLSLESLRTPGDVYAVLTLTSAPVSGGVWVLPTKAKEVDADVLELVLVPWLRPLRSRWGRHEPS